MAAWESIVQFVLAGASVVIATIVGRRVPYLGALILLFPAKVLVTLAFFPSGDKEIISEFLMALIPGLLAVAAFAIVAKIAINSMTPWSSFGLGLIAWAAVAAGLVLMPIFGR